MAIGLRFFLMFLIALLLENCTTPQGIRKELAGSATRREELKKDRSSVEAASRQTFYGMASYYGEKFHGKPTASGEIFNMHKLTAAHRTLPLGTVCRVTNLANHKSVIVRINDRGPFVNDRILDLSYEAARQIGAIAPGVIRVKVEVLRLPEN